MVRNRIGSKRPGIKCRPSGRWQARFRKAGMPSCAKSFDSYSEACEWLNARENEYANGMALPYRRLHATRLRDLMIRYRDEAADVRHSDSGVAYIKQEINRLLKYPIAWKSLDQLKRSDFASLRDELLRAPNGRGGTLASATVRRKLVVLQTVIAKSRSDWDLENWPSPMAGLKLPEDSPLRTQRFTPEIKRQLVAAWFLSKKQRVVHADGRIEWVRRRVTSGCRNRLHVYAVRIALETGLRLQAILDLSLEHIDWENQILYLPQRTHKNKDPNPIPVTTQALNLMRRALAYEKRPENERRVIPVSRSALKSSWKRLRKRAGPALAGVRFHDTRAEAITSMLENDLPEADAKAMANLKDGRSLQRYVRLNRKKQVERLQMARNRQAQQAHGQTLKSSADHNVTLSLSWSSERLPFTFGNNC